MFPKILKGIGNLKTGFFGRNRGEKGFR